MRRPIVFMFSGQGSHYYQMGKQLYDEHPRFRLWMEHCNSVVEPVLGESLIDIIYGDYPGGEPFVRLAHSNPALVSIQFSLAQVLIENGVKPDKCLGYSLGEFTSMILSGVLSLEAGLTFSIEMAKLLEKVSPGAGMLAIVESEAIQERYATAFSNCPLTARNLDNNFVVSGPTGDVETLRAVLSADGIPVQELAVRYGFHTALIDPQRSAFLELVSELSLHTPRIPLYSCALTRRVDKISDEYFWQIVRCVIEFKLTLQTMLQQQDSCFIDVGPSGTLSTCGRYLSGESDGSIFVEVMNRFGNDSVRLEEAIRTVKQHDLILTSSTV